MNESGTCWTCRWWTHTDEVADGNGEVVAAAGECRRFPAAVETSDGYRCGEWEPAAPTGFDQTARAMARFVLLGDLTAARALADRVIEACNGE